MARAYAEHSGEMLSARKLERRAWPRARQGSGSLRRWSMLCPNELQVTKEVTFCERRDELLAFELKAETGVQVAFGVSAHMKRIATLLVLAVSTFGCSGDDDDGGASGGMLQAPMLMKVMPMEGALHLEWMNVQKDCEAVEADRKMHSEPFAQVFSVPGAVDNKMDGSATEDMDYTYRLRCKKGAAYSAYSDEMSGNPTKGGAGAGG